MEEDCGYLEMQASQGGTNAFISDSSTLIGIETRPSLCSYAVEACITYTNNALLMNLFCLLEPTFVNAVHTTVFQAV
jgi:hypothetical protein